LVFGDTAAWAKAGIANLADDPPRTSNRSRSEIIV